MVCGSRLAQIVRDVMKHDSDRTQLKLVFGNITEDDILLKPELDQLAQAHADRFQVFYTLDKVGTVSYYCDVISAVDASLPRLLTRTARMCVPHVMLPCQPSADWKQGSGFVTAQMIKDQLPGPSDDVMMLVCGMRYPVIPPIFVDQYQHRQLTCIDCLSPRLLFIHAGPLGMVNFMQKNFDELGYTEDMVFKY